VQMQVHLHRTPRTSDYNPRNGAREIASFKPTAAERHPGWGGGLPQKEMNGGCGAKSSAALAAESREMAQEPSQ